MLVDGCITEFVLMSRNSKPFAPCHSERSEESNTDQDKLREGSYSAQGRLREEELVWSLLSFKMTRISSPRLSKYSELKPADWGNILIRFHC